jgi:hypothetical protein
MRKTFELQVEGREPARVVEGVKHELKKYLKRERGKALPTGIDFWDFDCKVGKTAEEAVVTHVGDLNAAIDQVVALGAPSVYIEVLSRGAKRTRKPPSPPSSSS